MWGDYDRGHMGAWGAGAWLGMLLVMLLVLAVGAVLVVLLLRWARDTGRAGGRPGGTTYSGPGSAGGAQAPGGAESLLAERFARGEIDEQEYLRRREVLRGG